MVMICFQFKIEDKKGERRERERKKLFNFSFVAFHFSFQTFTFLFTFFNHLNLCTFLLGFFFYLISICSSFLTLFLSFIFHSFVRFFFVTTSGSSFSSILFLFDFFCKSTVCLNNHKHFKINTQDDRE